MAFAAAAPVDYDVNKDDQVSAAEFKTVRDARFAATDADKDGV